VRGETVAQRMREGCAKDVQRLCKACERVAQSMRTRAHEEHRAWTRADALGDTGHAHGHSGTQETSDTGCQCGSLRASVSSSPRMG